jgi:Putative prokaryotic signal transducing protein
VRDDDLIRVTAAPNEVAAEVICGRLRSEGIACYYRQADMAQAAYEGSVPSAGWQEIVVAAKDLQRARDILAAAS